MQITVKTYKLLKEGTNQHGAWALYKIEAIDGKIYTTLADGADALTPGTVFEPADVILGDERQGVQEYKFKKFTVVTAGSAPPAPGAPTNGKSSMTTEQWADKDRQDRLSIEQMSAWRGIVDLVQGECKILTPGDHTTMIDTALTAGLAWAIKRLGDMLPAPVQAKSKEDPDWEQIKREGKPAIDQSSDSKMPKGFKNAGEFMKACNENLGLSASEVCIRRSVSGADQIPDLMKAYIELAEDVAKERSSTYTSGK